MPEVKDTQWYAYWEGVHQAVQLHANGTPMRCPYPDPPEVQRQIEEWHNAGKR